MSFETSPTALVAGRVVPTCPNANYFTEAHDAEKLIKRIQGVEERFAKVRRRDGHVRSDSVGA